MIDFWLDLGSPYSFVGARRVANIHQSQAIAIRWRPFALGAVFKAHGLLTSPLNLVEAKRRYMWRDLARRGEPLGLAIRETSAFPRSSLLADRVLLAGLADGWGQAFALAAFAAEFEQDRDIADTEVLADCVTAAGGDAGQALTDAASPAIKARLRSETDAAMAAGVFGAPSFVVGTEVFWGDDRLEEALCCARLGS